LHTGFYDGRRYGQRGASTVIYVRAAFRAIEKILLVKAASSDDPNSQTDATATICFFR
jgi:hypothetical protein